MIYTFFERVLYSMGSAIDTGLLEDAMGVSDAFLVSSFSMVVYWLIGYLFMGIGLYTMAKRRGLKHAHFAFIPFASMYLMGELVGEVNFLGWRMKRLGLIAMIVEIASFLLFVVEDFLYLKVLVAFWNEPLSLETYTALYGSYSVSGEHILGVIEMRSIGNLILDIVTVITSFVSGFIDFVLLLFLFRNYSPRNSFIFLVMAVLVEILGPILVFAIRKNSCEEYREFMRMKMHSMYGGGSPYQYGDGTYHDPYDLSKKQKGEENIEKPFSEYE